jgi:SAM-dependent methyltransferase
MVGGVPDPVQAVSAPRDLEAVKRADAGSYDPVTQSYDRFVERYSGRYVERIAALAALRPGERVLDVGTGTGILALHVAHLVGEAGRVTGIDLSDGMLAHARAKAERAGLGSRLEFRRMDAERLELEDGAFDAVVSLFALRHFPNPDAAIAQMRRVLRPGGRLVVAVGEGAPLLSAAGVAAAGRRLLDAALVARGRLLRACESLDDLVRARLPAAELEGSAGGRHHGLGRRALPARLGGAGFRVDAVQWMGNRAEIGTPEEFWELQATFSSMARARLQAAAPAVAAELREQFLRACRNVRSRGGRLVYPTGALIVAARRPTAEGGG